MHKALFRKLARNEEGYFFRKRRLAIKEHYEALCVEVLSFEPVDVITTSPNNPIETRIPAIILSFHTK